MNEELRTWIQIEFSLAGQLHRTRTTSAWRRRWRLGLGSRRGRRASRTSWEREQPTTEWPHLASSTARARPSPLLTPVISTVFPGPPLFIVITPLPRETETDLLSTPSSSSYFRPVLLCENKKKIIILDLKF